MLSVSNNGRHREGVFAVRRGLKDLKVFLQKVSSVLVRKPSFICIIIPIRSLTQIWVVTRHQYEISALFSQMSFRAETSGGVVKMSPVFPG